jgi:hypothetical protein
MRKCWLLASIFLSGEICAAGENPGGCEFVSRQTASLGAAAVLKVNF